MRSTNIENQSIAQRFPFNFDPCEFNLDKWGDVDFHCLYKGVLVLLEVEKGQKHPNTNVLKLWPYLEENETSKIMLLHFFRSENKAPKNRINLCSFVGKKLEEFFPTRFRYMRMDKITDIELNMVNSKLKELE